MAASSRSGNPHCDGTGASDDEPRHGATNAQARRPLGGRRGNTSRYDIIVATRAAAARWTAAVQGQRIVNKKED